jgi:hypothetical protein
MTDAELRALVRDAVRRHLGTGAAAPVPPPVLSRAGGSDAPWRQHASHQLYITLVNADASCVIEPAVQCDHCGYCKSHGH